MSTLSDEYIKNFSKERKAIFNKRFSDDYDPNMSERSNIIRILNEMRELGLADGGRIGYAEGNPNEKQMAIIEDMLKRGMDMSTIKSITGASDKIIQDRINFIKYGGAKVPVEKANGGRIGLREGLGSFETSDPKEAMREVIKRFLERNTTTVPITENIFLNLAPGVSDVELGGIMKILGGELGFGASKDKGIGFNFKKEFNKGGRVAYQDGTPDRQLYETPVTDAIKSVNEKTQDLIMQGKDALDRFSGIDEVYDFPGVKSSAVGAPSDFRHQAASNLLAEALGKGKAGPIGYLSGGIGSFGLGTIKEIGDFVAGVLDKNTTTKEAFNQALEDTISNFKGAFAPAGTTTEDLYAELMKDYQPIRTGMFDPFGMDRDLLRSQQIFAQRKKALEDARKKQKDFIEQEAIKTPPKKPKRTTTTKPGTGGGGGGFTPTTTAQNVARTASRVDSSGNVKAYGLARGGLAAMLGE